MAVKRDYYDVLELPRDASPEDIKKAFRKLALQYHPDRNKEPGTAERFKEVAEAYQVLNDPERRSQYDRFGHAATNGSAGQGFQGFEDLGGFGDIFDAFFGGSAGRGPRRGRDLEYQATVQFSEAVFGVEKKLEINRIELCDRCEGSRAEPGSQMTTCSTCGGRGQVRRVSRTVFGQFQQVAACSTCGGEGRIVKTPCIECRGRGVMQKRRTISVEVPAGIEDGSRIRMRGQGEPGETGAEPGDLYVHVRVEPHKVFEREGNDIHMVVDINLAQAALGAEIEVPTLEGKDRVKIRAGTQSGEEVRLRGMGVPELGGRRRGDQIIGVRVITPRDLTPRQRKLLEELAESFEKEESGGKTGAGEKSGIFGRFKDRLSGEEN